MQAAASHRKSESSPTIVMIHGMWSTPGVWADFARYFENRGYVVLAPALRHHDRSTRAPSDALGHTSLIDYVDDLDRFIRALGEPPILFGHSMGGLLAQLLAARGLARATVLLAPATPPGIGCLRPDAIRVFRRTFSTWRFWSRPQLLRRAQAAYGLFHLLPTAEQERHILAMVPDSGRALFELALPILDRRGAARVDFKRIRCPVLILAGAQDRIMPAANSRHLKLRYGDRATYVALADHAHWLIGEPGWEKVAARCVDWLASAPAAKSDTSISPD